ncbi:cytochrome P450 [Planotetraspora thailandica]|uniref:Cytochrome P450 n=1 Tax=Planotetraspora thailandica TaxID=487172 RepID=A0A8J3XWZ4_9ACTN|nr:cytochrome P450 [Planotetraspora thailandica]GII55460.1 cytochrome P450 [Planotetraspora thailandica]
MIASSDSVFRSRSSSPAAFGSSLAALGREQPVVHDEFMAAPLVLRHRDVSAALRDTATFGNQLYGVGPMSSSMIALDGAEHNRQRRIHNRFFSAVASARYASIVAPIAERTFGALAAKSEADLVEDAGARYPMEVFLGLLGIPDELGDQGLQWVRTIVTWLGSPMNEELAGPGRQAFADLEAYTRQLVERERRNPGDNLLGEVIRAYLSEDAYSPETVAIALMGLLLGGFETTIQMLSATIASLLLNPESLERVRADSGLVDAAIDEAFRWANPSAGLYRLVRQDTRIAGTDMPAGSIVYLCIAAAHFDEQAYPDAGRFDVDRRGGHLGFGLGPHFCVGAPLARIEVRAALTALLAACPGMRLNPGSPPEFYYGARGFVQHGTDTLRVLLDRR